MDNSQVKGNMWTITKRPQTLETLYGQEQVKKFLTGLREKNRPIPNVILFQGPTGTGKTTSAKILAKMIQCSDPLPDGTPCGKCLSCESIQNETYGRNTLVYDGASKTTKEEIEPFLKENLSCPPMKDRNKVFIIEEYQQLGAKAQEVVLKYFERPEKNIYFFLTAMTEIKSSAVLGRCQKIIFKKPNIDTLLMYLKNVLEEEGIWNSLPREFQFNGLLTIAQNADGSFRSALQTLEQCVNSNAYTSEEIRNYIGITDYEELNEVIFKILEGKSDERDKEVLFSNYIKNFQELYHAVSEISILRAFPYSSGLHISELAKTISRHKNFKLIVEALSTIMKNGGIITGADVIVQRDVYITGICELICRCKGITPLVSLNDSGNTSINSSTNIPVNTQMNTSVDVPVGASPSVPAEVPSRTPMGSPTKAPTEAPMNTSVPKPSFSSSEQNTPTPPPRRIIRREIPPSSSPMPSSSLPRIEAPHPTLLVNGHRPVRRS